MTAQKEMDMVWSAVKLWYLKAWEEQGLHSHCMARTHCNKRYAYVTDDRGMALIVTYTAMTASMTLKKGFYRTVQHSRSTFPLNTSKKPRGFVDLLIHSLRFWCTDFSSSPVPFFFSLSLSLFSMELRIFFGRSSCFYIWSRRVEQEGRLSAKLCGMKLNRNKNRTECVCVCLYAGRLAEKHIWTELNYLTLSHRYTSTSKLVRKQNTQYQGRTKQLWLKMFLSLSSLNLTLKSGIFCVLETLNLSLSFSVSLCGWSSI